MQPLPAESVLADLLQHADWVRSLARALAGEREADDLAQEVWLRAAEHPPQRPATARGWLRSVLRNAHFERRRADARRRAREARLGARDVEPAAESPDAVLARVEAQQQLVAALLRLDAPSRSLLLLRYFENRSPAEIAESLGLNPATLRSQLSRALRRLRQGLEGEYGRKSSRALVAAAAGLPPTASATFLVVGAGLGLAALAWAAAAAWEGDQAPSRAALRSSASGSRSDPIAPAPPLDASRGAPAVERRAAAQPATAAAGLHRVHGRCVEEDGSGLAGVQLSVHTRLCLLDRSDGCRGHEPIEALAEADGSFDFRFEAPSKGFRVEWTRAGFVTRHAYWKEPKLDLDFDAGSIVLVPGEPIRGRVTDPDGVPVAGVRVSVLDLPLPLAEALRFADGYSGQTDERGEFEIQHRVPYGSWSVGVEGQGSRLEQPLVHRHERGGAGQPLEVSVLLLPSIQGRCVDERGEPLGGVQLRGESGTGRRRQVSMALSAADGSFRLYARSITDLERSVRLTARKAGRLHAEHPEELAWGAGGLILPMIPAPTIPVTVVLAEDGTPVEDFSLQIQLQSDTRLQETAEVFPGPHPKGVATVPLQRGTNRIRVVPRAETLAVPPVRAVVLDDRAPEGIRVSIEATALLRVQVLSAGQPVAGATVECLRGGERPPGLAEAIPLWRERFAFPGREVSPHFVCLESSRLTDLAGRADLPTEPEPGRRWLILRGPFEHEVRPVDFDPSAADPLVLEMHPAAALRGRLECSWLRWAGVQLHLTDPDQLPGIFTSSGSFLRTAAVDEQGQFAFPGLKPGVYDLHLDFDFAAPFPHAVSSRLQPASVHPRLMRVTVRGGENDLGTLRAPEHEPGTLDWLVRLDGKPAIGCVLSLIQVAPDSQRLIHSFPLDETGRLRSGWIIPGPKQACLQQLEPGSARVLRTWFQLAPLAVTAGGTSEATLDFRERIVRIRVLDRDGATPLQGVRIDAMERRTSYPLLTDAEGWCTLDWAPLAQVALTLTPPEGAGWNVDLEFAPDEAQAVRTLRRPGS